MTLPPEPEEYIHRVGRVGRADAVGLAISLVGTHQEKVRALLECCGLLTCACQVWYHKCNRKDRGRGCSK